MSVSNGQLANASTFNNAFVSKTADSTVSGTITQDKESVLKEIATPATPGSGYGKIYFKSDGKLYQLNDAGIETQVGSGAGGGAGGVNFITNGTAEDNNTTGWAVYADAAGTSPVDGTGGTANVTITTTATTPLAGTYSFLMAKDAVNRQGQGWSYDFTIDSTYQAKVLQISFDYLVSSGTFSAGSSSANSDVTVWIYDVTNAVLIQPSNIKLFSNSSSLTDKFQASFQSASNSTSYRLIFHVQSTSASAYTLEVDNVSVSPSQYVFGTPVTDWQDFPSVAAGTLVTATTTNPTYGTVALNKAQWRRVGSDMEIRWDFRQTTAGTAGSGTYLFNLPAGYSIDTNRAVASTTTEDSMSLGVFNFYNGSALIASGATWARTATQLQAFFQYQNGATGGTDGWSSVAGVNTFGTAGARFSLMAKVPIAGWSSSVQTSDSADTRVVAFSAYDGGSVAVTNTTSLLPMGTTDIDTHAVRSGETYVIPVSGFYRLSAKSTSRFSAGNASFNHALLVYKNGAVQNGGDYGNADGLNNSALEFFFLSVNSIFRLNAGDVIDFRYFTNYTGVATTYLKYCSIERLSGPSAIAASETVAASYYASAGTTSTTTAPANFDTKIFDTHNAVTTGASWRFTAPISGKYSISAFLYLSGTVSGYARIYKNGTWLLTYGQYTSSSPDSLSSGVVVNLNAGEYIDLRSTVSIVFGGGTIGSSDQASHISIVRVGN